MDYFKIIENETEHQPLPSPHEPAQQTWQSRLTVLWLLFLWQASQFATIFPMSDKGHFKLWKIAVFLLIFVGCVWLSYRWARKHSLIPKINRHHFPIGKIASGLGIMFATGMLSGIIMLLTHTDTTKNQEMITQIGDALPPLVFFILVTSAGFFEELIFRVSIFELLFNKWPKIAISISWVLFMIVHQPTNFASFMSYGLASLVFTGLYAKYRNFYLNMSVHFLWNTFSVFVIFLSK